MDRCAARVPGGLLAVSGISEPALERLRVEAGVELAIRNGGSNVILGGPLAALDNAERMAVAAGAQCTRLRVNVASHTSWMREAAESFSRTLADVPFRAPQVALFSNAADRIRDAASATVCAGRSDRSNGSLGRMHGERHGPAGAVRAGNRSGPGAGAHVESALARPFRLAPATTFAVPQRLQRG